MSSTSQRTVLLSKIASAQTYQQRMFAVAELEAFDRNERESHQRSRDVDLANAVIAERMSPVASHVRNTIDTDWMDDFQPVGRAHHTAIAEASLWFDRTSPEVKADLEEFGIQAEGFMRREASKYGDQRDAVLQEGLTYLGMRWRQHTGASGLDQIQQTYDPNNQAKSTPLPTEVYDNFAPEIDPINQPVVGTETSERAPMLQILEQQNAGAAAPEVQGGHSEGPDFGNSYSEVPPGPNYDMSSGPLFDSEDAPDAPNGPDNLATEASLWSTPTVAIGAQTGLTLDDFRHEAASSLDQVQQTIDANNNPHPTVMPEQVAFPWIMGPDAYHNGQPVEGEEDEETAPFGREASHKTAGAEGINGHIQDYVDALNNGWRNSEYSHENGGNSRREFAANPGRRFTKIVSREPHWQTGDMVDTSAHSFVDNETGNVHKASGWSRPGPARYNLLDPESKSQLMEAANNPNAYTTGYLYANGGGAGNRIGSRKVADQWGASGLTPNVPQPDVANTPATAPNLSAGYADGYRDAQDPEARPTFADASSAVAPNVKAYSQGYSDVVKQNYDGTDNDRPGYLHPDVPGSMGGQPGAQDGNVRTSSLFIKDAQRQVPDFKKGYNFARKWAAKKPLIRVGSLDFETGLLAGIADQPYQVRVAWHQAHLAAGGELAERAQTQAEYVAFLEKQAGTTLENINVNDPTATASPSGSTPINGPGTVPILEGETDPAAPGGPAPYNGAAPLGQPAVPNRIPVPSPPVVNLTNPNTYDNGKYLAFRKTVQANLLTQSKKKKG